MREILALTISMERAILLRMQESDPHRNSRLERLAVAALGGLIALGLWQAYGEWLFGGVASVQ